MNDDITAPTQAEQLAALVQGRLLGRDRVIGLCVVVQEEGLVLQGSAPSFYAKQLAQHAAMEVSGLPILANEIEVR